MKYQITKKQCQEEIKKLGNVCDYCGRDLKPIKTVDNSGQPTYWKGCMHGTDSGNYTYGVKRETYDLAVKLVLEDSVDFGMDYDKKKFGDFDYAFEYAVKDACDKIKIIEYYKTHKPRYTKKQLKDIYFPQTKQEEED